MKFNFYGEVFETIVWTPNIGAIGPIFSFDCETDEIKEQETPSFILGQAFAGSSKVYLIQKGHLKVFFEIHKCSTIILHNAPFDISVVTAETSFDFHPLLEAETIFDTGILYRLAQLAQTGQVPHKWALNFVAKELLGIDLDKDNHVRCGFGQYKEGTKIHYADIPPEFLEYASKDVVVTLKIFNCLTQRLQTLKAKNYLSHSIQLKASLALKELERRGVNIDQCRLNDLLVQNSNDIMLAKERLTNYGYVPGTKGINGTYDQIISKLGISLGRSSKGGYSQKIDDLKPFRSSLDFIDAFLTYQELNKNRSFIEKLNTPQIHTKFKVFVDTGRTASSSPNIQNIPRNKGLRECFIPSAGNCFLIIDYSTIELCALAQICFNRFGFSVMQDLINRDLDLHRWFAAQILNKPEDQVTKNERQQAKACNFGFPAGLGITTFIDYAKNSYGITNLSESDAKALKKRWQDAFPEMKRYLNERTCSGIYEIAETLTGRIRSRCSYTQARNTPFQGLAADGAKLALYELIRRNFRVVNFIHDEFLIEIPITENLETVAKEVDQILVEQMRKVIPNVKIKTEYAFADRWYKNAQLIRNPQGQIEIFSARSGVAALSIGRVKP